MWMLITDDEMAKKGCLFVGAVDAEATHLTKPNASAGGRGY